MTASHISGAGLGFDFPTHCSNGVVDSLQNASPPYGEETNFTPVFPGTASTLQPTSPSFLSVLGLRRCPFDYSSSTRAPVNESQALARHGTLLSANAAPGRNAAELSSILGDSTSRLKLGAMVLPLPEQLHQEERTSLEQAKTRARVKVDIILNSYTYVQGGYLQGHVKIKILECARNEVPVLISGGKVRVIGFESISNQLDKYPFYQCSSPLETVTVTSGEYHDSYQDSEGFAQAIEGEHTLPFSMYLPMSADYGVPKGSIQAGVAIRYIAMVSIKVKDPLSNGRSIAHFCRSCEIWPRLDPSVILAPAGKPLPAKIAADSDPHLTGSHGIKLMASIHRLHWVAGQQCFVKVSVANESKKTVKSIALALIRTTIVFKPGHRANTFEEDHDEEYDVCSTSTTQKPVAESVLEMGRHSAPRHASAKGWWPGVAPGEHLECSHSILLPPDALSVIRSRLLQVDYSVRVTLSAGGTLRTAELQVSLPIQIVNFISVDPPPSLPSPILLLRDLTQNPISNAPTSATLLRTSEMLPFEKTKVRALRPFAEENEERLPALDRKNKTYTTPHDSDFAAGDAFDGISYDSDDDSAENAQHDMDLNPPEDLECFTVYEDDPDEIVPHILQDDPQFENAPRFADLYYHDAPVQKGLTGKLSFVSHPREERINYSSTCPSQYQANLVQKVREYTMLRSGLYPNSILPTHRKSDLPKGPSSFASRVQAKLAAAAEASSLSGCSHIFPGSGFGSGSRPSAIENLSLCKESMIGLPSGDPYYPRQPHASDMTVSSGTLARGDQHTTLAELSTSESTSSLPYTRSSTFTSGGSVQSRLLPKPPVVVGIDSAGYRMDGLAPTGCTTQDSALNATQPSPYLVQLETDLTSKRLSQHQEQAPKSKEEPEIDYNRLGLNHALEIHTGVLPRPSLLTVREQQAGTISNGSTNSVKEKIRELEERQRLLQLNEANGVRSFV